MIDKLSQLKNFSKQINLILFLLIFSVSVALRFFNLYEKFVWGGVEGSFIWDIWYTASGHPTLIGFESAAIGGLNFPPFLLYFLVPFFWIFSGNPIYIAVILSLLGGIASVLFFVLGKKIFGIRVAILSTIIDVFSYQVIVIDHKFIGGTFMIIPSLLVIYILWRIYQEKKDLVVYLILLGTIIGLSFSAHYQAAFLFLGVIIFLFFYKKRFLSFGNLVIFTISTLFWMSTLLLFDLRHNFYHIRGFLRLFTSYTHVASTSGFLVSGQYFLQNFLGIFWQQAYFYKFDKLGSSPILLIILLIFILCYFLIWKSVIYSKLKPVFFYFAVISLLALFGLSFYRSANYQFDYYYWFLVPVFIFSGAFILNWFLAKNKILTVVTLLFLFLAANIHDLIYFLPSESYQLANQTAKRVVFDAKAKKLPQITVKFQGAEVGTYDYLIYYYSKKVGINPDSITLISGKEEFQERNILGSGKTPIKILSKAAGSTLESNYLISRAGVKNL